MDNILVLDRHLVHRVRLDIPVLQRPVLQKCHVPLEPILPEDWQAVYHVLLDINALIQLLCLFNAPVVCLLIDLH